MNVHEIIEVKNLTRTRKLLHTSMELRPEISIEVRATRVAEYARQVATYGKIVTYLPIVEPRKPSRRSRFANGDIMHPLR